MIRSANPTEAAVADFAAAADTAVRAGRRTRGGLQKVLRPTPQEVEFSLEERLDQSERQHRGHLAPNSVGTDFTDTLLSEVGNNCRSQEASLFEGSRATAGARAAAALVRLMFMQTTSQPCPCTFVLLPTKSTDQLTTGFCFLALQASGNDPSSTLSTRAINLLDNHRLRQQEHDM